MAKIITPLTATQIKNALPQKKTYKLFDGGGLFLEVPPRQSKRWRLKYRINGKEKSISLGTYPKVSLSEARKHRELLKEKIKNGIDPSAVRKEEKENAIKVKKKNANTFKNITESYFSHIRTLEGASTEAYLDKQYRRVVKHCYPTLKNVPVDEITEENIIVILETIKDKGHYEVARRVLLLIKSILRFAVKRKIINYSVAADIIAKEEIGARSNSHYPIIVEQMELGELLVAIDGYSGDFSVKQALRVMPHLAFRPHNIRFLEWEEINFEKKLIEISGNKMKMKRDFICPISDTIIQLLIETKHFSGDGKYVFPSTTHTNRPLSENTLNMALRRLGYTKEQIVSHSFRGIFSTIAHEHMHEHGCSSLSIEMQLAHKDTNQIRDSYNSATLIDERKKLIVWWSDYLDKLKEKYINVYRK